MRSVADGRTEWRAFICCFVLDGREGSPQLEHAGGVDRIHPIAPIACRVRKDGHLPVNADVSRSTFDTEKSWPQNKLELVDAMVRLEKKLFRCLDIFSIIQGENVVLEDDPHGTILPDIPAALSYAERTIRELRGEDSDDIGC